MQSIVTKHQKNTKKTNQSKHVHDKPTVAEIIEKAKRVFRRQQLEVTDKDKQITTDRFEVDYEHFGKIIINIEHTEVYDHDMVTYREHRKERVAKVGWIYRMSVGTIEVQKPDMQATFKAVNRLNPEDVAAWKRSPDNEKPEKFLAKGRDRMYYKLLNQCDEIFGFLKKPIRAKIWSTILKSKTKQILESTESIRRPLERLERISETVERVRSNKGKKGTKLPNSVKENDTFLTCLAHQITEGLIPSKTEEVLLDMEKDLGIFKTKKSKKSTKKTTTKKAKSSKSTSNGKVDDYVFEVLVEDGPMTANEIAKAVRKIGWKTKYSDPTQEIYNTIARLGTSIFKATDSKPKAYSLRK